MTMLPTSMLLYLLQHVFPTSPHAYVSAINNNARAQQHSQRRAAIQHTTLQQ
jgi:hypothetical protein